MSTSQARAARSTSRATNESSSKENVAALGKKASSRKGKKAEDAQPEEAVLAAVSEDIEAEAAAGDTEPVAAKKASRGKTKKANEESTTEGSTDEEAMETGDTAAVKQTSKKGRGKGAKAAEPAMEEESEENPVEAAEKPKRGGKKAPAAVAKQPEPEEDAEKDAEEELLEPVPVPVKRGGTKKGAKQPEKETEEAEMPPKRATKPTAKAAAAASEKAAVAASAEKPEEDEEAQEEVSDEPKEEEPKAKGKKAAAAGRGKKAAPKKEEEEEEEAAPKAAKGKKAPAAKRGAKKAEDVEEEEEEKEKEESAEPVEKKKKVAAKKAPAAAPAAPSTRPRRAATKAAVVDEEHSDEDEGEKKKKAPAAKGKRAAKKVDSDEEEEKPPAKKGRGKPKKEMKEEEEEEEKPKSSKSNGKSMTKSIRRTVVKGRAAVDRLCDSKVGSAHVFEDGELIYDVMLNQTNIGNNNNKYYILQLLEEDGRADYSVWFRWGRVGYDGQNKLETFGGNLEKAKAVFAKKFSDKTKNEWPTSFEDFERIPGKYTMIEVDYSAQKNGDGLMEEDIVKQEIEEETTKAVCTLDERVQHVLGLICSLKQMRQTVMEMEYDADKAPLGKLTKPQITEGYECLKKIETFINAKNFGAAYKDAVNEYYTKIPHACGFRPPEMIRTPQKIKAELELLDLLQDIEIAITAISKEKKEENVHPMDRHYSSLACKMEPLEKKDNEYKVVAEYLANTHAPTHHLMMNPRNIFRIDRDGEDENEEFRKKIGNRKLLWHGSRLSNYFGILSQGLRIAPPEAPCTGYMFGKGVYFADMATKSGNYCYPTENTTGYLILAEVALGDCNPLRQANYDADRLPKGKSSTWGVGRTLPDPKHTKIIPEDVVVPCGKPVESKEDCSLLYNEYIVYDVKQIRLRYLVEVDFKFRSYT